MPTPLFVYVDDAKPRIDRHHTNDVHGILIPGNHIFEILPPKHIVIDFADCRLSIVAKPGDLLPDALNVALSPKKN